VRRRDGDDRELDVREQVHADARIRQEPEDDERRDHHHGEDGTPDGDVRDVHGAFAPTSLATFVSSAAPVAAPADSLTPTSTNMPTLSLPSALSTSATTSTVRVLGSMVGFTRLTCTTRSIPTERACTRSSVPGESATRAFSGRLARSSRCATSCTTSTV